MWRERWAHWGELVQMDGSKHDWFEGRRGDATLMVMIDDAPNRIYARFFESETTGAAMEVFEECIAPIWIAAGAVRGSLDDRRNNAGLHGG